LPLTYFRANDFRCLESVELAADGRYNLVFGANASGKTSLLEAIAYLGRGKSFRGAATEQLVRHGAREFVLFGRVDNDGRGSTVGVRNGSDGLEISVNGDGSGGVSALAQALPLQIIDPDVHNLVAGSPEERRRYLDWVAFHVEHGYLEVWRRYRRSLKQRNAALKSGAGGAELSGWDREFAEVAEQLTAARERVFEVLAPCLEETAADLLAGEVGFEYRRGWAADRTLAESLAVGRERDRQLGSTQSGPQRADIRLVFDERQAKKLVSRGQQKLLACSMVLGATETAQAELERPVLLLLDDPAAELDAASLQRLMQRVVTLGCQVFATSLEAEVRLFPDPPAMFHVEHGHLTRAG
jgi:DNA replication and repair protein RecF